MISSGDWEVIGEDSCSGELSRLRIPQGWLVQVTGAGHWMYGSITFVPDHLPDQLASGWSVRTGEEEDDDAEDW